MRLLVLILGFFIQFHVYATYPEKINKCSISSNIVNAIVMQETRNRNIDVDMHPIDDYSIGYAQVRISTAHWMLVSRVSTKDLVGNVLRYLTQTRHWKLSKLLSIKYVNLYFARNYLRYLCRVKRGNFKQTIVAYNVGPWAKRDVIRRHSDKYFNEFMRFYKK